MPESNLNVRRAEMGDKDTIEHLWIAFLTEQASHDERLKPSDDAVERWQNDYPSWIRRESRLLWVAESDGQIVGFLTAQRYTPAPIYAPAFELHIDELYVAPPNRHKGVGEALLDAAKKWAEENEINRLRLVVLAGNEEGRAFWKAVGARPMTETATIELSPAPKEQERPHARLGFAPAP